MYQPFVEILINDKVGIADNGTGWRTGGKMLLAGSKAHKFEDNIDATQSQESPKILEILW